MKTYTITNQKGGVGKTTTAHILATGLTGRGYKVLAVDADPQTNLTFTAGVEPQENTLYDLMKARGATSSLQAVQKTPAGFYIIPGSLELAGADMEYTQAGREYIIKELLDPIKEKFDYCIIDTPPTLGILTVNALTACNEVIVPMEADIYSLQGLSQLQGMLENTKKYCNQSLKVAGLLLTRYNPRAVISQNLKDAIEEVAGNLQTKVFNTCIRETVAIKEIHFLQGDLFREYPKHNITRDYNAFIDELLKGRVGNAKEAV